MIDSPLFVPTSKALSASRLLSGGSTPSSSALRGLRSVLTAVFALSLGIALVSWLKAGDDARPSEPSRFVTTRAASAGRVLGRPGSSWPHTRATQAR